MAITMNGGRSKEGDGNGDEGGRRATAMATKRAIAMAMRVVLSFGRYLDQRHRRRACPELVADRAMVLML